MSRKMKGILMIVGSIILLVFDLSLVATAMYNICITSEFFFASVDVVIAIALFVGVVRLLMSGVGHITAIIEKPKE